MLHGPGAAGLWPGSADQCSTEAAPRARRRQRQRPPRQPVCPPPPASPPPSPSSGSCRPSSAWTPPGPVPAPHRQAGSVRCAPGWLPVSVLHECAAVYHCQARPAPAARSAPRRAAPPETNATPPRPAVQATSWSWPGAGDPHNVVDQPGAALPAPGQRWRASTPSRTSSPPGGQACERAGAWRAKADQLHRLLRRCLMHQSLAPACRAGPPPSSATTPKPRRPSQPPRAPSGWSARCAARAAAPECLWRPACNRLAALRLWRPSGAGGYYIQLPADAAVNLSPAAAAGNRSRKTCCRPDSPPASHLPTLPAFLPSAQVDAHCENGMALQVNVV